MRPQAITPEPIACLPLAADQGTGSEQQRSPTVRDELPSKRQARRLVAGMSARKSPLSRRILIIEDHPDGRETLQVLLELLGHEVQSVGDGLEGVRRALQDSPEIALIDIGLPGLDGYQVARQLRAAFGSKILLIAQTAYCQPEDRARAREAGFDAHLSKPIDMERLMRLLHQERE